ncbi:WARS1, partial [Symbiodinium microadriaticum]
VPFLFTKWLQEAFDVPLVIELTDDEKFLFKKDLGIDEARRLAWENAKDIIACGFDPAKTFIFRDTDYIGQLYPVALQIQKRVTLRTAQNTFGFTLSDNIGKCAFTAIQASPSFAISFPDFLKPGMRCFIPQAIDQDPYFRLCRRVADDLKWPKPALVHSKFLPALQGHQTKMSASVESTALYMTDTPKKLRKKINKKAFSGGGKTLEEQQKYGANLDVDVSYQYLKIWLEDDEELEKIGTEYAAGRMLTGEVKKRLADVVGEIVVEHQVPRVATQPIVAEYWDHVTRVCLAYCRPVIVEDMDGRSKVKSLAAEANVSPTPQLQRSFAPGNRGAADIFSSATWNTEVSLVPTNALTKFNFEVSAEYDLFNQGTAVRYFEDLFYEPQEGQKKPSLNATQLEEVEALRHQAYANPVLALAGAQVLYMFGWFRSTGELIWENILSSAELFERSIYVSDCKPEHSYEVWHDNACDIRWTHAILLYHWLAQTDTTSQQQAYQKKAQELLEGIKRVQKYEPVSSAWTSPGHVTFAAFCSLVAATETLSYLKLKHEQQVNFNSIIFAGKPSRPIWATAELPIGKWLEEHHHIFKAELQAILNEPGDVYGQLMKIDPSREHLATPGGWDTLRIVRYHNWFEVFCQLAPVTCELIKTRPEINECKFMNVNYVRLNPGTHLKPHYGNGPRLSAHLSVIAPEPMKAGLT